MLDTLKPRRVILRKTSKWIPKKWKPIYEEMLLLSVAGKSNGEIAEFYGYTAQQISNILSSPIAQAKKSEIVNRINEDFQKNEEQKLKEIAAKSIDRIRDLIFDDEKAKNAPFAMFDRSVTLLKAVGKLNSGESGPRVTHNTIVIGKEIRRNLLEGIEKANRVAELYGNGDSQKLLTKETA